MFFLLAGLASAGTLDGWENSRWLVEIEETMPIQFQISGPTATPPVMRAFQIHAVLKCPEFKMAGKKAAYVTCTAEDLAMKGSPQAFPGDRLDEYEAAFEGLRSAMASGTYEMKIKEDGRVTGIDFKEPPKTDPITVEAARALAIDLLNGFSLLREDVPDGAPWDEVNSTLVRAPGQPLGNGKTKIRHQPLVDGDAVWLQSAGDGSYSSQYLSWGAGRQEQIRSSQASGSQYGSQGGTAQMITRLFMAAHQSMTLESDTGPFTERMWNTESVPNTDSTDMTGVQGTPLWSAGHIRRLKSDEKVELGESGLTSAPGAKFGDLPDWEPIPTLPPAG